MFRCLLEMLLEDFLILINMQPFSPAYGRIIIGFLLLFSLSVVSMCSYMCVYCQHLITFIVRLVNETRTFVLMQAGMQVNQFASVIECAGNITNFTENHAGKTFFFFFSRKLKKDLSLNVCVCHKKSRLMN